MKIAVVEFFGTSILLLSIVGSGFMATRLSDDLGVALLINASVISLTLLVLIYVMLPISGAYLNPVVVLLAIVKRSLNVATGAVLTVAQVMGAIFGSLMANYFFTGEVIQFSSNERISTPVFAAEVVATFGLIFIIALKDVFISESALIFLVPAWIYAAIFFTSSTAFANPAVTVARYFTDSFTGISSNSVPWFILAEIVGALIAIAAGSYLVKKR
jgi:glycerol uptake facilitator-like aquaporin